MKSVIANYIELQTSPVAIILSNNKPVEGLHFQKGAWGCVASMLHASALGQTSYFDRDTFGCPGGGVGLGFGNRYIGFPIEKLLSNEHLSYSRGSRQIEREGEGYCKSAEIARKFVDSLPITDIAFDYVIFKPVEQVNGIETPTLVMFLVNPDQLSALVVLANYERGDFDTTITPFGAGCHTILFGYAEAQRVKPRGIIGMFDITARKHFKKDIFSYTAPYSLFKEMEANAHESFLVKEDWKKLNGRNKN